MQDGRIIFQMNLGGRRIGGHQRGESVTDYFKGPCTMRHMYLQEYQLSFSHFLRLFSFAHGIQCRRCKKPLYDHELEFYFNEVCVSIKLYRVRRLSVCLPNFKNSGSTRNSLLQRELQECQQGFNYCRDLLVNKIEERKRESGSEALKKALSVATRKLDKMKLSLSEFLQQQFLRGEVLAIAQHHHPLWRETSAASFTCKVCGQTGESLSYSCIICEAQHAFRSKPQTPNPKSQTPNPKPQTPNPKPQTPNPNPQTECTPAAAPPKSLPPTKI